MRSTRRTKAYKQVATSSLTFLVSSLFYFQNAFALVHSEETPSNNAGFGDHRFLDRHNVDCGLGAISRVQLRMSIPATLVTSGRWDYHYDCETAYQDGKVAKSSGWNNNGFINDWPYDWYNVIYLDRHALDCGNKPLLRFQLANSGSSMQYNYSCGTSSLSNISDHWTPANSDGQNDEGVPSNGIYLDRHDVHCPGGKVLTYMRLQRPSGNQIRYHYKCGSTGPSVTSKADKTTYPVVFMHGMGGAPTNFADSFGTDVAHSPWLASGQQTFRTSVAMLNNSEHRGNQAFDQIVSYMVATGAQKVSLVGHSQGGLDMRKVAHRLKHTSINNVPAGVSKVSAMISLQSPHRGSRVADKVYDVDQSFLGGIANWVLGDVPFDIAQWLVPGVSNFDFWAGIQQLRSVNMVGYNNTYPSEGVADYVGSFLTAQEHGDSHTDFVARNTPCQLLIDTALFGAFGGDNGKDDCLVSVEKEQMGHRLVYNLKNCVGSNCSDPINSVSQANLPYVSNLNHPGTGGSDLNTGVLNYDHFDMINSSISASDGGFDEHEFYAALIDFIACKEHNPGGSCDDDSSTQSFVHGQVYHIQSQRSGKFFDLSAWGQHNGNNLQQWDFHGGTNQRVQAISHGDGWFTLKFLHSNRCVDGGSGSLNHNLYQWDCHMGNNQRFKPLPLPGGLVLLQMNHGARCVDQEGHSHNGGNVKLWDCSGGNINQQFRLIRAN